MGKKFEKFKARFIYDWVLYVAVTIAAIGIWSLAFGLYNAPAPTETINLFFAGDVIDRSLQDEGVAALKDYGVKSVQISSCNVSESLFNTKYSVVGLNGCDVVLVPESVANETECASTFTPLNGLGEEYLQGEVAYGVYLPDKTVAALGKYFEFTSERYVVFAVGSSPNAGEDGLTDNAVKFIKWLLDHGNN